MKRVYSILVMLMWVAVTALAMDYAYNNKGGVEVVWNNSDIVGFYTVSNNRIRTTVYNIDSFDKHKVILTGNGWLLTSNSQYYGYYPYNSDYQMNGNLMTALPIKYIAQTQSSNDNASHIAKVDYMTSQTRTTDNAAEFTFTRLGSILRIAAYVPEEKTFTSLTLTARDNTQWFTTEATMNATNNTMIPTATAASATLSLNNITVAAGDSLIAYLMTAPADLSGKSMQLSLQASDGSALQTYLSGCNIQAGKAYPLSVGRENYFRTPQSSALTEDEDTEEILSLQLDIENYEPTDAQITTATAYAPDFTPDASNKMKAFLLGDVNLDGVVDVTDAVLIINHYQARTTEQLDFNVSDVNGDSVIDVTDAVGIINIYQNRMQ